MKNKVYKKATIALLLSVFLIPDIFASSDLIFAKIKKSYAPEEVKFNWDAAVMMWGMAVFAQRNPAQGPEIKKLIEDYYLAFEKNLPRISSPDLAAPALAGALLGGMENDAVNKIISEAESFIVNEPRNSIGALNHVGHTHRFKPWLPLTRRVVSPSIWGDSMIMYVLNGMYIADFSLNHELRDFINTQPRIFIDHLQHQDGLFRHAYFLKSKKLWPLDGSWLRGHGWVMAGLVNMIEAGIPGLEEAFRKAASASLKYQNENGLWGTIIETPLKNEETSGSSLLAYALAKGERIGLLGNEHKKSAEIAWTAIKKKISFSKNKTKLNGCSGYTNAMPYASWYRSILVRDNKETPFCLGAFLLAASELETLK